MSGWYPVDKKKPLGTFAPLGLAGTAKTLTKRPITVDDGAKRDEPVRKSTKLGTTTTLLISSIPTQVEAQKTTPIGHVPKQSANRPKILRAAGGEVWEDPTLIEWDPNDFRMFVGNLGNEVTDATLQDIFKAYKSFVKARVVRDSKSSKTKGYGFVSFKMAADFLAAMKDWNGKHIGNRPCTITRSKWTDRSVADVRKVLRAPAPLKFAQTRKPPK